MIPLRKILRISKSVQAESGLMVALVWGRWGKGTWEVTIKWLRVTQCSKIDWVNRCKLCEYTTLYISALIVCYVNYLLLKLKICLNKFKIHKYIFFNIMIL